MVIHHLRHDRREWRIVEFKCPREGEADRTFRVLSAQTGYREQDLFLNALRAQIRRPREATTPPRPNEGVNGGVLATFGSSQPDGSRAEYELRSQELRFRYRDRWKTVEAVLPLRNFLSEKMTRTYREPFNLGREAPKVIGAFTLLIAVPAVIYGAAATEDNDWEGVLFGLVLFLAPCLLFGGWVGIGYWLHDRREWRFVEFCYRPEGEQVGVFRVLSDEAGYVEHEQFVNALRNQLRRVTNCSGVA